MNSISNNIFAKNIKLFKSRFPSLFELYKKQIEFAENNPLPDFYQILNAKNGELTANERLSDGTLIHLHSAYYPCKEAENAIKAAYEKIQSFSTTVFYGFGLGYHVLEWVKQFGKSGKKLVLIENDVFHFLASLSLLNWENVFSVEKLIFAIGCPEDSILGLLEDSQKINLGKEGVSDTFFFDLPSFTKHNEIYFTNVKEIVKRNLRKNEINAATLKKFEKLWTRNSTMNKKYLTTCKTINEFENSCTNPEDYFIVVGAGPTLQSSIKKIKELKNANQNNKIICVETALHHLVRNSIVPDFIILSDPQYWAYKHLCGLFAPESILITDISVYPSVFRFPCKEIRLMAAQFPLAKQFEKEMQIFPADLGTGGSVASVAFNFAVFCGYKKIILAGTDFSFPYKQSHVKGSSAEQTFHTKANRLTSVEKLTSSSIYSANPQIAQNYKNENILTDSRMKMFAWWFESRISALDNIEVFSLSSDAMKIPNVKPL